jgi:hypothetical protein
MPISLEFATDNVLVSAVGKGISKKEALLFEKGIRTLASFFQKINAVRETRTPTVAHYHLKVARIPIPP